MIDVGVANLVLQGLARANQIVTGVCAILKRDLLAVCLKVAQVNRPREHVDLPAAIVDIIFTRYHVARVFQQSRQRVAKDCATGVAHVQRPRRVGGDVFHIDLTPLPHVGPTKACALRQNARYDLLPDHGREPEVQKAGACDLGTVDPRILGQFGGQRLRDIAGLFLGGFGQNHRSVRRHISVTRIAWWLNRDVGKIQPLRQRPILGHSSERGDNGGANISEQVHMGASFRFVASFSSAAAEFKHPQGAHGPAKRSDRSCQRCNQPPNGPTPAHLLGQPQPPTRWAKDWGHS